MTEMQENDNYYGNYSVPKKLIKKQEIKMHSIENADNTSGTSSVGSGLLQGGRLSEMILTKIAQSSANKNNKKWFEDNDKDIDSDDEDEIEDNVKSKQSETFNNKFLVSLFDNY
jgi:hypothetical protein